MENIILCEKEVVNALSLPSLPKKEWDGKTSFKDGVAVVTLYNDRKAYAVCTFDAEVHDKPQIKHVFLQEPFFDIEAVYVVPSYMDNAPVEDMDLDEESKRAAQLLINETDEIIEDAQADEAPTAEDEEYEWVFPEIKSLEEAQAWLKSYNQRMGIKGNIPQKAETVKLRLYAIKTAVK